MKVIPYIEEEKCIGCGICVEVCPNSVFVMIAEKSVVMHPENCNGYGICVENCPTDAITLKWADI